MKLNRRNFISSLLALPVIGKFLPVPRVIMGVDAAAIGSDKTVILFEQTAAKAIADIRPALTENLTGRNFVYDRIISSQKLNEEFDLLLKLFRTKVE